MRPNLCQARLTLDRGYVLGSGEALLGGGDRLLKPHSWNDDERWNCSGQWLVVSERQFFVVSFYFFVRWSVRSGLVNGRGQWLVIASSWFFVEFPGLAQESSKRRHWRRVLAACWNVVREAIGYFERGYSYRLNRPRRHQLFLCCGHFSNHQDLVRS